MLGGFYGKNTSLEIVGQVIKTLSSFQPQKGYRKNNGIY